MLLLHIGTPLAVSKAQYLLQKANNLEPTNPTILLNLVHIFELSCFYSRAFSTILSFFTCRNIQLPHSDSPEKSISSEQLLDQLRDLDQLVNLPSATLLENPYFGQEIFETLREPLNETPLDDSTLDCFAIVFALVDKSSFFMTTKQQQCFRSNNFPSLCLKPSRVQVKILFVSGRLAHIFRLIPIIGKHPLLPFLICRLSLSFWRPNFSREIQEEKTAAYYFDPQ